MKKTLAIVLALVLAFSMTAMAFADDVFTRSKCKNQFNSQAALDEHAKVCPAVITVVADTKPYINNECPKCGAKFVDEAEYNKHVAACDYYADPSKAPAPTKKDYVNLTVKDVLNAIVELIKSSNTQWDDIESVVNRLVDLVENLLKGIAVPEADVNGAIDDLKAKVGDSGKLGDLLDSLKAKIKSFYAGDKATTEATTAAEKPAETGSATAGIAAFAAISVAVAAAYVCTKKKA